MSEWRRVSLSEIVKRVTNKNTNGSIEKVLTVSAEHGLIAQESYFTKKIASADTSGYYVVAPGQFVYNKSTSKSAAYGTVARNVGGESGIVSPLYFVFETKEEAALPEYLELALNSDQFFRSLAGMLREGARSHGALNVRLNEFYSATLSLPPKPLQERIVEVIRSVDDQIAALAAEANALADVMAALRNEILMRGDGWDEATVGAVSETRTGRAFPNKYQGNASGEIPYFKVADMNAPDNSRYLTTPGNWLDIDGVSAVKPKVCPAGTVVFPIIGAALLTEKRRILARPSAFDQNLMGLVPNDRVLPGYLFAVMSNFRLSDLTQPGAVPSVNQKIVSGIRIPLAPIEVQEQIVKTLDSVRSSVDAKYAEARSLRTARAGLLSGLLSRSIAIEFGG
ncbi:restriction endonuclease subunit S [Actinoplanes sp. NPDC000266]